MLKGDGTGYLYMRIFVHKVKSEKKFYTSGIGSKMVSKIMKCTKFILMTISIWLTISDSCNNYDIIIVISNKSNKNFLFR